jgi:hypothetical protein
MDALPRHRPEMGGRSWAYPRDESELLETSDKAYFLYSSSHRPQDQLVGTMHANMSGLTLVPDVGQENIVDVNDWRYAGSPDKAFNPCYRTHSSESSSLVSLRGGSDDLAEVDRDIWWETIGDEIYWIYPIYLGRFRGDYSRNSHLVECRETAGCCHPLNPGQFRRLVELQGWTDFERTAQYRAQENIGSLFRGTQLAIFKLLHKIEEYQLFPGQVFEGFPQDSWSTGSSPLSSPIRLTSPTGDRPWTGAPLPSTMTSRRRSLTASQQPTLVDPQAIALPYSLSREWSAPEPMISPISSTSTTPVPVELDGQ